MVAILPFGRFDVIDQDLVVIMRGATLDSLASVTGLELETDLATEVRWLLRERRSNATSTAIGLIDMDYRVSVYDRSTSGPPTYLVVLERIAIRGTVEKLATRYHLDAEERELARLLVGGYSESTIAWRLGCSPGAAAAAQRDLFAKTSIADRQTLVSAVFARKHAPAGSYASRAATSYVDGIRPA